VDRTGILGRTTAKLLRKSATRIVLLRDSAPRKRA
jgi:hypothetical protein